MARRGRRFCRRVRCLGGAAPVTVQNDRRRGTIRRIQHCQKSDRIRFDLRPATHLCGARLFKKRQNTRLIHGTGGRRQGDSLASCRTGLLEIGTGRQSRIAKRLTDRTAHVRVQCPDHGHWRIRTAWTTLLLDPFLDMSLGDIGRHARRYGEQIQGHRCGQCDLQRA